MKLVLAAVGRLKTGPERELFDRYAKRAAALGPGLGLSIEFREFEESRAREAALRRADEARMLLAAAPRGAYVAALDERGASLGSAAWAQEVADARDRGDPAYIILIGGPDGLDEAARRAARRTLAFGAMTWPHQLARVMAAEQLYRICTLLASHPYHRV